MSQFKYLPGDIVMLGGGACGVVTEATEIIDGQTFKWNNAWPQGFKSRSSPKYSIDKIPGKPCSNKIAWWTEKEITSLVHAGPLHRYAHDKI
jgi:hypothetical protein